MFKFNLKKPWLVLLLWCCLLFLFGYRGFFVYQHQAISSINIKIVDLTKKLGVLQKGERLLERQKDAIKVLKQKNIDLLRRLKRTLSVERLLKQVFALAKVNDIQINKLQPKASKQQSELQANRFQVDFSAHYQASLHFIQALLKLPYLISIEQLKLARTNKSRLLQAELQFVVYRGGHL